MCLSAPKTASTKLKQYTRQSEERGTCMTGTTAYFNPRKKMVQQYTSPDAPIIVSKLKVDINKSKDHFSRLRS